MRDRLQVLGVLAYIEAGCVALLGLLQMLQMGLGLTLLGGEIPEMLGGMPGVPEALLPIIGVVVLVFIGTAIVFSLAMAAAIAYLGYCLTTCRNYRWCVALAGVCCTQFPLGSVLGVFILVTLVDDDARMLFGQGVVPAPTAPAAGVTSSFTLPQAALSYESMQTPPPSTPEGDSA